jgi:tryptophan-rich sensory protein
VRPAIAAVDRRSLYALAGLLALCLAVGALGGAVTRAHMEPWYDGLEKPFFTPPDWLFAPVWTVLYAMMAFAAWRVWRRIGEAQPRRRALRAFAAQLALNLAWTFAFFGAESPALGLLVIVALPAAILWTILLFMPLDRFAALLMVPYAAWVAYAAVLNLAIFLLN